ncbi:hypothetical protein PTTG_11865 [Puccinia triticina 1-1 BBBD Race 1]|uniref:Uncharacterized protein n=1 Tax=Puccinia triticina (isolate 1-1 / race 1 (BBBD)) TaxID=630390 RepID=A0A180GXG4_PUCT1|nr:hypothetical protein PTTG_11865 [Puccinia triticina 1-1 BBBD Race 1]WAR60608.1 hypothetical protein PtB15_9B547 [Puccinia triticina]
MYSAPALIQPISAFLVTLSKPIHPTLFPFALFPILHAFRISVAYRSLNKQAGGATSVVANLAGFLLMAWGGSIISHILLNLPIPQLLSFSPVLLYATTHFCLPDIKNLPKLKTLDTIFPLVDALLRTTSIAAGVEACRTHPSPAIRESLSIQLFIGAVASSGGGISAQTLSVWEPSWRLNRPIFLQEGTMLASTDVWSGTLVAVIYGCLTASHPEYLRLMGLMYSSSITKSPLLSAIDAKAAAASILALIYCWRVYNVHYSKALIAGAHKDTQDKSKKE